MRLYLLLITALFIHFAPPSLGAAEDATACAASDGIAVADARVRPAIVPGRPAGGYLTICNGGADDDRLLSVASPQAARIEIHETRNQDGIMTMSRLDGVAIPAGESRKLSPGARHLMIFGLSADSDADMVLRLTFERAGVIEVQVPLQQAPHGHDHH